MDDKTVAVTGGTGFVGRKLISRLMTGGEAKVRAICRKTPFDPISGVSYIEVDDLTSDYDFSAFNGVETLVHAAARAHLMNDEAVNSLSEFRSVNVKTTIYTAEKAALMGVKRFVFLSSIGVNGLQTEFGRPFTELDDANPHNAYTLSKWEAEQALRAIAAETGMEVVIIRPPLVYGANAPGNFGSLLRAVQHCWPLPLGTVRNKRSLVALDNLVDLIVTCLDHPAASNQTFLVSDGQDLSTAELVHGMAKAAGVPARLFPVPVWALQAGASLLGKGPEVQRLCGNLQVDISKARSILGWVPPVTVAEGLQRAMRASDGFPISRG